MVGLEIFFALPILLIAIAIIGLYMFEYRMMNVDQLGFCWVYQIHSTCVLDCYMDWGAVVHAPSLNTDVNFSHLSQSQSPQ